MNDYERIAKAITFLQQHMVDQPSLDDLSRYMNLSPFHCNRLFSRWAGVSPKRYLQVLTVNKAKLLLRQQAPVMAVADEVGLSGGSRLHDHFINIEALSPGEYKNQGQDLQIKYGFHATPFGQIIIAQTVRGICKLVFVDDDMTAKEQAVVSLQQQWPGAQLAQDNTAGAVLAQQIFAGGDKPKPLSLVVKGTNFQVSVWRALLRIPVGKVCSYQDLAQAVNKPKASRAIGQAVGKNPLAFLVPCHRVVRKDGDLGGYHWGLERKQAILAWECPKDLKIA